MLPPRSGRGVGGVPSQRGAVASSMTPPISLGNAGGVSATARNVPGGAGVPFPGFPHPQSQSNSSSASQVRRFLIVERLVSTLPQIRTFCLECKKASGISLFCLLVLRSCKLRICISKYSRDLPHAFSGSSDAVFSKSAVPTVTRL